MSKFIIGLIPYSERFRNAIAYYCQATQGGLDAERTMQIFQNCLSQICSRMDRDSSAFMLNIMELPVWSTINYTDVALNGQDAEDFRNAFREFAMSFWEQIVTKTPGDNIYTYILESCSISMAVVALYVDADHA